MILLFFFASGLSALIYQVVWTRAAGLAMGNSPAAIGTVVAVFMAGLALGSAWAGKSALGNRPLRLYGLIEIAIGVLGMAVPWLFRAAAPLQKAAYDTPYFPLVSVLCSALILLPATILMGATLPLLVRHAGLHEAAGRLYAVNSAGAALGALAAGLFLIPRIGLAATTLIAVLINVAIGAGALRMASRAAPPAAAPAPLAPLTRAQRLAVGVYSLSGFAALVCEMAWTRALVLALGSTVYAFTLILFGFILGLALGSELGGRWIARRGHPLRAAALIQLLIAAWGAALIVLLADLPVRMRDVIQMFSEDFLLLQLAESLVVLGLVLPPTMLMGALLPVAMAVFKSESGSPGQAAGRLYSANTLAAIAGTLLATFLLVPRWGVDGTLRLAGAVNLAAVLLALAGLPERGTRIRLGAATAVVGLVTFLLPRWDLTASASGGYLLVPEPEAEVMGAKPPTFELEAAYWDAFGLVTVQQGRGRRILRVNGKVDASSGGGDMPAQILTSQIPLFLHPDPRDVLVIGLASGITLASAQAHDPATIDCCEISPAMVRAAAHFAEENDHALTKPGTRIITQDGRTHIRYGGRSYDVIVSEPSNLWISGMGGLFTREFFQEARARLRPGGLFAQWVHAYRISPDDFRGVVRTFSEAFPQVRLWEMDVEGDYLLTGSMDVLRPAFDRIQERASRPAVARMLRAAGAPDGIHLLAFYMGGTEDVAALGATARLLTDDDCWIEYTAPFWMLKRSLVETLQMFGGRRRSARELLKDGSFDEAQGRVLDRFADSRRRLWASLTHLRSKQPRQFRETMDALTQANPDDALARWFAEREGQKAYRRGLQLKSEGQLDLAFGTLAVVPAASSRHAESLVLRGWIRAVSGKRPAALALYRQALEERPRLVEAQIGLSQLAEAEGRIDEARTLLEEAVGWAPDGAPARLALARFLWRRSEKALARAEVERALRDHPDDSDALQLREAFTKE